MPKIIITFLLVLALAGCASADRSSPPSTGTASGAEITPTQAILAAAERPAGISGIFEMEVRGGGRQNDWLYLNSEADYRDQRCLTIAIPPTVAPEVERQIGGDPVVELRGKTIRVRGTAKRTTIWFISNGVRTDKYYYQTHVLVTDPAQVAVHQ
jgi:hypothetical protein